MGPHFVPFFPYHTFELFFIFFMSGMNMEKVVSFELLNLKSKATVDVVVQKTE